MKFKKFTPAAIDSFTADFVASRPHWSPGGKLHMAFCHMHDAMMIGTCIAADALDNVDVDKLVVATVGGSAVTDVAGEIAKRVKADPKRASIAIQFCLQVVAIARGEQLIKSMDGGPTNSSWLEDFDRRISGEKHKLVIRQVVRSSIEVSGVASFVLIPMLLSGCDSSHISHALHVLAAQRPEVATRAVMACAEMVSLSCDEPLTAATDDEVRAINAIRGRNN